ncbi:MAG: hypothetical protein WA840_19720 [Caulobacteraceae bacterium]
MTIRTYQPRVSVTLLKNIARTTLGANVATSGRYRGAHRQTDLTRFLGHGGSVVTRKSIRHSAGQWSVTLTDQSVTEQLESLYGLIEPMDVVEIRMAHDVSPYYATLPKHMPILMRGFVSHVSHKRAMSGRGPVRSVTISGQDYGRLLEMINIVYLPGMVVGQNLTDAYHLFLTYGLNTKSDQTAGTFISGVMTSVVAPFIANMRSAVANGVGGANGGAGAQSPVLDFGVELDVQGGSISPFGSQEWKGGTVDALLRHYADVGPWNELYVEDREGGPFLVYRATPFKDLTGAFIQQIPNLPTVVKIPDCDVVDEELSRSDDGIANYYWVDAPRYNMVDGALLKAAVAGSLSPPPFVSGYANCASQFYGVRAMQLETQQGPRVDGQDKSQLDAGNVQGLDLVNQRRDVLIKNNRDNVVLESGRMTLRGNETIKAGVYLQRLLGDGRSQAPKAEYYVTEVRQDFKPFGKYETTVEVERGTGFVVRAQQGGGVNSPYLSDLNLGGVYGT